MSQVARPRLSSSDELEAGTGMVGGLGVTNLGDFGSYTTLYPRLAFPLRGFIHRDPGGTDDVLSDESGVKSKHPPVWLSQDNTSQVRYEAHQRTMVRENLVVAFILALVAWMILSSGGKSRPGSLWDLQFGLALAMGVAAACTLVVTAFRSRPSAWRLTIDDEGVVFDYPQGKTKIQRWSDGRFCLEIFYSSEKPFDDVFVRPHGAQGTFFTVQVAETLQTAAQRAGLTIESRVKPTGIGGRPRPVTVITSRSRACPPAERASGRRA